MRAFYQRSRRLRQMRPPMGAGDATNSTEPLGGGHAGLRPRTKGTQGARGIPRAIEARGLGVPLEHAARRTGPGEGLLEDFLALADLGHAGARDEFPGHVGPLG